MSEPVSKAEIEDVLSSIRRLVSENSSSIRREPSDEQGPDKLVLTPAFRVDDAEQADAPEPEAQADTFAEPQEPDVPAADGAETEWRPEADARAEHGSDPLPDDAVVSIAPAVPDVQTEPESEPETEVARVLSPLEQRIAELEAIVARSAADFEPDGSEDDAPETFVFQHQVREQGDAPAVAAEEAEAEGGDFAAEVAEIDEEAEPDMPGLAAVAVGGVVTEQDSEPEFAAELAPEFAAEPAPEELPRDPEPLAGASESDAWEDVADADDEDDSEAFIDEEALREMVARMVREELQGTIGERITHNVRRMVRREIARALSLQEFD